MTIPEKCPNCHSDWFSRRTIPEDLMHYIPERYTTREKAELAATAWGWTEHNQKRFATNVRGIAFNRKMIQEYQCTVCHAYFDAITFKMLNRLH